MSVDEEGAARIARAQRIWRSAFHWGLAIVFVGFIVAGYFARQVWPLARVPLHLDMTGAVNRWGSGREGAVTLLGVPAIALFVIVMVRVLTRVGPRIEAMAATPRLLGAVFVAVPLLLIGAVASTGALMLSGGHNGSGTLPVRLVLGGAALLVAGLGNFLGKTQRNWYIGVRTPWSLSSDLAWGKSNRIAGRLMVITGLAAAALAAFGPVFSAGATLAGGAIVMAIVSVYVSWATWRTDPNRTA